VSSSNNRIVSESCFDDVPGNEFASHPVTLLARDCTKSQHILVYQNCFASRGQVLGTNSSSHEY